MIVVDVGGEEFDVAPGSLVAAATSTGRLMLAVLGGLADVERDLIRTRTAEGRSRAKAQGKHMGRPPSLNTGTTERGHQTPRAGRYAARIGAQLQCKPHHDFATDHLTRRSGPPWGN